MLNIISKDTVRTVELAIVVPEKGKPGRKVGTLIERVPEDWTLPQTVNAARHRDEMEASGVLYIEEGSYQQSVEEWKVNSLAKLNKELDAGKEEQAA